MAKTNLVKMEVYFDLDTQSFIALDPETGEFRDFSVSKKSTTTKKKSVVSDDATPKLILETSKYTLTQAAANLLGVEPDDRIDIKYQKIGNILVPVIGSNTAFGTKAGNKLTKSLTVSCRGKANEELSDYGSEFTFKPHPNKEGLFILEGDKPLPEPKESKVVKIDDKSEHEKDIDDDLADLLDSDSKTDDYLEINNDIFEI